MSVYFPRIQYSSLSPGSNRNDSLNSGAWMALPRLTLTVPIFYVNAAPHVGHLYTALIADVLHRWHRLKHGPSTSTLFIGGTDEHGLKIQQAAATHHKDIRLFCDENSSKFQQLFKLANISCTHFVRTTEERHKKAAHHAWTTLQNKGLIYKGSYSGWYSTADETFLTQSQLKTVDDVLVSAESGHKVEWMEEENYLFRLSEFHERVKKWLVDVGPVKPGLFNQIALNGLEEGTLTDLSVSRSSQRLKWGIEVPNDSKQIIYVWLDALMTYLTACGYPDAEKVKQSWPANVQIIGKDILKFHAIYWPSFLMGLDLEPPKEILCHSHWLVDHQKMSKSVGNVVDPFDRMEKFTSDGFRYFLMREGVPHSDSNYSDEKLVTYLNAELANTFGNLLGRCTSKAVNASQTIPLRPSLSDLSRTIGEEGLELLHNIDALPATVEEHYNDYAIYKAITAVMDVLRQTNVLVQNLAPWTLAKSKDEADKEKLQHVLFIALHALKVSGLLLSPVIPSICGVLLGKLGVSRGVDSRTLNDLLCDSTKEVALDSAKVTLFERIVANDEGSSNPKRIKLP